MKIDQQDQRRVSGWALPGSLAVHLLVVLLVVFGLPVSLFEPEAEQAIDVELVPPEAPAKEAEPPPPPEEAEKPEEKPEEKKADTPPPEGDEAAPAAPPAVRPVFRFGEKDAGPREARDGNSPQAGAASPEAAREPDEKDAAAPQALSADKAGGEALPPPGTPETPSPKPAQAAEEQEAAEPGEAKRLFSQKATGDATATMAMGDVPRGVRAGRLCVTELREQLQNALPPYYPDLLPSYRLEEGTVIDAPNAAFRGAGRWYELSYRCEVDADATRVVDFAFRVGRPVPRSEWARRKLPVR